MANPQTTHVIEIETGIGEPAFIPLSMGQELQPISVGKKGMWRLESPRVLDVHAFVYFDGSSLFLQSADESNAASVDGFRVGKAWTELHAPCIIEVGQARLRFRSLIADDNQATEIALSAPVQAPPGGPGAAPGSSMPVAAAPPRGDARMQTGQRQAIPQPAPSSNPVAFPKNDRPFKPGEFASAPDEGENTRIAPLETTGGGRMASGAHARPPLQVQGAMAGMPPPGPGYGSPQGFDPNQQQQPMPVQPLGFDPNQAPYPPPQMGYPNPNGSGPYGAMGPNDPSMQQMQQGPMGTGGYPVMQQGMQQPQPGMPQHPGPGAGSPTPGQALLAKLKENSIPKIVAGLLFIIGGILYLAEDDDPPPPKRKPVASLDGGAVPVAVGTGASSVPVVPPVMPPWPAGVPCPPPNWPPNTPLPCVPNGVSATSDPNPNPNPNPNPTGGRPNPRDKDAGAPATTTTTGGKSLERQAVDFVASGDTARAAAAYEELVRREPNNKVYAEAARILRAKLDAGAPQ